MSNVDRKAKELIVQAIPLIENSWWQSLGYNSSPFRANGCYCPIIAVSKISKDDDVRNCAIGLMDEAAGKPINIFNDEASSVGEVIEVMKKAAQ